MEYAQGWSNKENIHKWTLAFGEKKITFEGRFLTIGSHHEYSWL